MLEIAKSGVHLLHSKITIISSVRETPSPLEHFPLHGGSQLSSILGKSVLMSSCFFLFISTAVALLSKCPLLPLPVLSPLHHLTSHCLLAGAPTQYTHPLALRPLNMEENITRTMEGTVNCSVPIKSSCAC